MPLKIIASEQKPTPATVMSIFENDMTQKGWVLLEDAVFRDDHAIKLGERTIMGRKIVHLALGNEAACGQLHAEWLLRNQEIIPTEWQECGDLVFAGTKWSMQGCTKAPCLKFRSGVWALGWCDRRPRRR